MNTKESLLHDLQHPDFISGVHNYCDRWCETCPFTVRCAVYVMGTLEEMIRYNTPDSGDNMFDKESPCDGCDSLEPFEDEPDEADVGDDELSLEDIRAEENEGTQGMMDQNEAVLLARDYTKKARQWFDGHGESLAKEVEQLLRQPPLGIPGSQPLAEAQELGARFELLQRYYLMILVKIQRAVRGDIRGVPEMIKDMPRDADGSAKVALITIDRSIRAWTWLRDYLQQSSDTILDILFLLGRLRETVEADFPDARAFVRPGFDTHEDFTAEK